VVHSEPPSEGNACGVWNRWGTFPASSDRETGSSDLNEGA
jgi:hypothetical protein